MQKTSSTLILIGLGLFAYFGVPLQGTAQDVLLDRTVLPIPQPIYPPVTELDARNVKPPPFFQVKAPDGAPNVLIVLIDDMGFGQSSAFGGPVHMPTSRPWQTKDFASTSFTRQRFARQPASPC